MAESETIQERRPRLKEQLNSKNLMENLRTIAIAKNTDFVEGMKKFSGDSDIKAKLLLTDAFDELYINRLSKGDAIQLVNPNAANRHNNNSYSRGFRGRGRGINRGARMGYTRTDYNAEPKNPEM